MNNTMKAIHKDLPQCHKGSSVVAKDCLYWMAARCLCSGWKISTPEDCDHVSRKARGLGPPIGA